MLICTHPRNLTASARCPSLRHDRDLPNPEPTSSRASDRPPAGADRDLAELPAPRRPWRRATLVTLGAGAPGLDPALPLAVLPDRLYSLATVARYRKSSASSPALRLEPPLSNSLGSRRRAALRDTRDSLRAPPRARHVSAGERPKGNPKLVGSDPRSRQRRGPALRPTDSFVGRLLIPMSALGIRQREAARRGRARAAWRLPRPDDAGLALARTAESPAALRWALGLLVLLLAFATFNVVGLRAADAPDRQSDRWLPTTLTIVILPSKIAQLRGPSVETAKSGQRTSSWSAAAWMGCASAWRAGSSGAAIRCSCSSAACRARKRRARRRASWARKSRRTRRGRSRSCRSRAGACTRRLGARARARVTGIDTGYRCLRRAARWRSARQAARASSATSRGKSRDRSGWRAPRSRAASPRSRRPARRKGRSSGLRGRRARLSRACWPSRAAHLAAARAVASMFRSGASVRRASSRRAGRACGVALDDGSVVRGAGQVLVAAGSGWTSLVTRGLGIAAGGGRCPRGWPARRARDAGAAA